MENLSIALEDMEINAKTKTTIDIEATLKRFKAIIIISFIF